MSQGKGWSAPTSLAQSSPREPLVESNSQGTWILVWEPGDQIGLGRVADWGSVVVGSGVEV